MGGGGWCGMRIWWWLRPPRNWKRPMNFSLQLLWRDPDDGMLELRLLIEGERQSVAVDFYDYADELKKWGEELMAFPASANAEVAFEKGAKDGNAYLWLAVRAFVADGAGNTALEIEYQKPGNRLHLEIVRFATPVEAATINRLGVALKNWEPTEHAPLIFRDSSAELGTA
jgi:hypothetical protein